MARQPVQPTPPPEDPLADLRQESVLDPVPGNGPESEGEEEAVVIRPMVTKETQEEMVAEAVAAFHADPTTQGFLHGGGQCGCRYVARVALQATVPVMVEEDLEERELEPAHG